MTSIFYSSLILNAPDGHLATVSIISEEVALSIFIHGFSLGLKTEAKFRAQTPERMHFPDCQT